MKKYSLQSEDEYTPQKSQSQKYAQEFIGLFFLLLGCLLFLSLITYSPADPTLNTSRASGAIILNKAGLFGAYLSGLLVDLFGLGSYAWAILFIGLGGGFLTKWLFGAWWKFLGYILFAISFTALASAWDIHIHTIAGGGLSGDYLYTLALQNFSHFGSCFICIFILLLAIGFMFGVSCLSFIQGIFRSLTDKFLSLFQKKESNEETFDNSLYNDNDLDSFNDDYDENEEVYDESFDLYHDEKDTLENQEEIKKDKVKETPKENYKESKKTLPSKVTYSKNITLPSTRLLSVTPNTEIQQNRAELEKKEKLLIHSLADYNIEAAPVRVTTGPVVTMFEIRPAAGVRVSRILSLADDLAMKLKAIAVRIQAPVQGCDTVGIEVPNDERANVSFRELLEGNAFKTSSSLLTMALGKNINGMPIAQDLTKMPHLLVAGATGAGKSVCLNTIILSFLYKSRPNEVKLLLIDPKRVELTVYNDLPHLVHPVVTDMQIAKNALTWAVDEMDRRYSLLSDMEVRNIASYNEKVKNAKSPILIRNKDSQEEYHEYLPYLVIIIDELADLMLTHGKDVESSLVRLAQLARAAGIHIILATQRPSVDVVTGIIKANFPCRISFQVTQKVDSRTILDTVGAEALLGKGDMLFKPAGGKLQRLHGAFIPDDDVSKIVNYWKKQHKPDYTLDFNEYNEEKTGYADTNSRSDISQEPVYQQAIDLLPSMDKFSISALQRHLRIGFNKAALIKEQLERDGYINDK